MPIVTIQLLIRDESERIHQRTVQNLADQLGDLFDSKPSGTWVKLEYLSSSDYAENQTCDSTSIRSTSVEILKSRLPDSESLALEADQVAAIVALELNRPKQNTHVFYLPEGRGRVAFGGRLRDE